MRNASCENRLWLGISLTSNYGLDLGKKPAKSFGGLDRPPEGIAFAEGDDVVWRILQTDPIGGAVRAQQFYAGCGEVGLQAGDINVFIGSGRHSSLLGWLGDKTQAGPEGTQWGGLSHTRCRREPACDIILS